MRVTIRGVEINIYDSAPVVVAEPADDDPGGPWTLTFYDDGRDGEYVSIHFKHRDALQHGLDQIARHMSLGSRETS